MKNLFGAVISIAASLILAAAVCAAPRVGNGAARTNTVQAQAAQTQSVSGKIASVEKTSFTLSVAQQPGAASKHAEAAVSQTQAATQMMTFQIDKNTTIDGKLKVGASADVSYRQDASGNNVAISVRVSS